MSFSNVYEDRRRAAAYATLEFPGTYHLAFRDLPGLYREHARGPRAIDFGCGAGRSTRFARAHGFDVVGIDVSAEMVALAKERDPEGDYRAIDDGDFSSLESGAFGLVQSLFTFDNVPGRERKAERLAGLAGKLVPGGRILNVISSPEIYVNEWASFTTARFPGNFSAKCGDPVFTVMKDVEDDRPVEDVFWPREDWFDVYRRAGLTLIAEHRPLGREDDGYAWISETRVAPWVIDVLGRA